ncbi:SET and MYND domain-containing protein 4 [Uranotaenia lowii]|uniref:SET and MYND domain-containing protein 4 n=1 Tax=Uranotaenia lowii TaxID=190385 RepID=UPI00247854FB|nr:SET and MYND domain-containing protein 4 [Uranotaenia lowii]
MLRKLIFVHSASACFIIRVPFFTAYGSVKLRTFHSSPFLHTQLFSRMEKSGTDGFFINYCEELRQSLGPKQWNEFANLKSDEQRFAFANSLKPIVTELKLTREFRGKNLDQSLAFKSLGNKAFQKENWNEALVYYNMCYLATPEENESEKAVALANRSAALYHMEKYDQALGDIERAIKLKYPKELMYKLTERKARCYLAKKDHARAIEYFKKSLPALDDCKLPLERRQKLERDAQIMINLLTKNIETEKKLTKSKRSAPSAPSKSSIPDHYVDKGLYFDYTEEEGRFAKTNTDLTPNTIILLEKPYVSALLQEYSLSNCCHCFKRVTIPIACAKCSDVLFCSENCERLANTCYHKYECGFLSILWKSGASITCHMALRIIAQKSEEYFKEIGPELASLTSEKTDKLPNDDYRKVFKFVTHEEKRSAEDLFLRTLVAALLNSCLAMSGFYKTKDSENFIGGLILHNLQLLQYNSHEISELQRDTEQDQGKSTFIGGGLYPTLALFNHSCEPGVTRFYRGNAVCVRAVKRIKAGSMIAENYGPMFTQVPREERRATLEKQYKFTCNCKACVQNWPLFTDLDPNVLRFKCDGGKDCSNVLNIPAEINEFMIQCPECGEHTNIMKGLKSLQDTEMLFKMATKLHANGEYEPALYKYVEMMNIMEEVLVPPYRDFHLCQQGLRACMLEFGNRSVKSTIIKPKPAPVF